MHTHTPHTHPPHSPHTHTIHTLTHIHYTHTHHTHTLASDANLRAVAVRVLRHWQGCAGHEGGGGRGGAVCRRSPLSRVPPEV